MDDSNRRRFLARAAECERMADDVMDRRVRRRLLNSAARWRSSADAIENDPPNDPEIE